MRKISSLLKQEIKVQILPCQYSQQEHTFQCLFYLYPGGNKLWGPLLNNHAMILQQSPLSQPGKRRNLSNSLLLHVFQTAKTNIKLNRL